MQPGKSQAISLNQGSILIQKILYAQKTEKGVPDGIKWDHINLIKMGLL